MSISQSATAIENMDMMTSSSIFVITAVVIVIVLVIFGFVTILLVLNQIKSRNIYSLGITEPAPRLKGVQKQVFILLSEMKITSVLIMRMTQKEYMLQ